MSIAESVVGTHYRVTGLFRGGQREKIREFARAVKDGG